MATKEYKVLCRKGINKAMDDGTLKHFPQGSIIPLDDAEVETSYTDLVEPKGGVWMPVEPVVEAEPTPRTSSRK